MPDMDQTPPDIGLDVGQAAAILGISAEAVRKRLKRGSLQGSKDSAGRWRVRLDKALHGGQDAAGTAPDAELIRTLRDEISFLRQELAARSTEVTRAHTLLAQQVALPPPPPPPPPPSGLAAMVRRLFGRAAT